MWKKGDRVKLKEGFYFPTTANPCIGSEFECAGTIHRIESDAWDDIPPTMVVNWDNNNRNSYTSDNLKRYCDLPKDNPNRAFVEREKECKLAKEEDLSGYGTIAFMGDGEI